MVSDLTIFPRVLHSFRLGLFLDLSTEGNSDRLLSFLGGLHTRHFYSVKVLLPKQSAGVIQAIMWLAFMTIRSKEYRIVTEDEID